MKEAKSNRESALCNSPSLCDDNRHLNATNVRQQEREPPPSPSSGIILSQQQVTSLAAAALVSIRQMSKEGRSGALVAQVPSRARAALKLYALLTEGARARPRDTVAQLAPARARVRNTATRAAYRCVRACSCWMLALVGAMFPRRWRWGMRGVGGLAAGAKRGSARSSFSSQASAAAPMRHGGGRARQSHVRARARARKGTLGGPHA